MKLMFFFAGFLACVSGSGQMPVHVEWTFQSKKMNATTYELRFSAILDNGWHIYSHFTPGGGPIPTSFTFSKNPLIAFPGSFREVGELEEHDESFFGVPVKQYSNRVEFIHVVNVIPVVKTTVRGTVTYMTCNDRECLPPRVVPFAIELK
ncbi:MAG: protein-disulfide reductase DsbD domain-containing protein [Flavisolibacter sp.]